MVGIGRIKTNRILKKKTEFSRIMMLKKLIIFFVPFYLFITAGAFAGEPDDKLIVYYFHRTVRCPSCTLLEELTRYTVTSGFDAEIKNGRIELKVLNIDEPRNFFFEEHYDLPFQSVVVSRVVNGNETKWKNLTRVWDYLHEEGKFTDYVQKEIKLFLQESKG